MGHVRDDFDPPNGPAASRDDAADGIDGRSRTPTRLRPRRTCSASSTSSATDICGSPPSTTTIRKRTAKERQEARRARAGRPREVAHRIARRSVRVSRTSIPTTRRCAHDRAGRRDGREEDDEVARRPRASRSSTRSDQPFDPALHEAVAPSRRCRRKTITWSRASTSGLRVQRPAAASRARGREAVERLTARTERDMAQTKDFYAVLGVSRPRRRTRSRSSTAGSPRSIIRTRTRTTQRPPSDSRRSPRRNNVLGDPEKRKQYDEMRRLGAFGGFGGERRQRGARTQLVRAAVAAPAPASALQDFDIGGLGGLGDLFSSMFGGGAGAARSARGRAVRRTRRRASSRRSRSRSAPLRSAARCRWSSRSTRSARRVTAAARAPGATLKMCPECNGRGMISFGQGGFAVNRPCPMCLGRGQVPSERVPDVQAARARCARGRRS